MYHKMITAVNIPSTSLWIGGVETVVVSGSSGAVWTSSRVQMALEASVATGLPDPSSGSLSFRRCCRFSRLLTLVSQEPERLPWQSCSDHCMQINCKCWVTAIYKQIPSLMITHTNMYILLLQSFYISIPSVQSFPLSAIPVLRVRCVPHTRAIFL